MNVQVGYSGSLYGKSAHVPVMVHEMLHYMAPKSGETYVDSTFGAGGYSDALLKAADCNVIAIDADPYVEIFVTKLSKQYPNRFRFLPGRFGEMAELLEAVGVESVDGIVLDIGVSSMQLDTPGRGFSFQHEGPLDMRMSAGGRDASSLVNEADESELAGVIYRYGGERMSRKIARAIITARSKEPITTTKQLADIIRGAVRFYGDSIDPATRTFQALRIWVNDELEELEKALSTAERLLRPGGRLVVVSFHSLEDRIVKDFLKKYSGQEGTVSRYQPEIKRGGGNAHIYFAPLTKKTVMPSAEEIQANPRARSAKLRAAVRL